MIAVHSMPLRMPCFRRVLKNPQAAVVPDAPTSPHFILSNWRMVAISARINNISHTQNKISNMTTLRIVGLSCMVNLKVLPPFDQMEMPLVYRHIQQSQKCTKHHLIFCVLKCVFRLSPEITKPPSPLPIIIHIYTTPFSACPIYKPMIRIMIRMFSQYLSRHFSFMQ